MPSWVASLLACLYACMQTKLEPHTVGSPALIPCEMTAMSNCRDVKGLIRDPSIEHELDYVPFPQCTPPEQWLVHCCQILIKKQNRHLFRSRNKTVVPMAEGHCFLFFIYCPALPCFEFSFCCQGQEEEVI